MVDIYFLVHTGEANYNGEDIAWFKSASVNGIVWANRATVSTFCFNYSVFVAQTATNTINTLDTILYYFIFS